MNDPFELDDEEYPGKVSRRCDRCSRIAILVIDRDVKAITGYDSSGDAIEEWVAGDFECRLCRKCADYRDSRNVPEAPWEKSEEESDGIDA
jgi:hypothetical protein